MTCPDGGVLKFKRDVSRSLQGIPICGSYEPSEPHRHNSQVRTIQEEAPNQVEVHHGYTQETRVHNGENCPQEYGGFRQVGSPRGVLSVQGSISVGTTIG